MERAPSRKVTVGIFCNACVGVGVWILNSYYLAPQGLPVVPAEQAVAVSTILTGIVQYLIPDPR